MTAVTNQFVYVVGKKKPDADKKSEKANAKRIAEAVARTAQYKRK